MSDSVNSCFIYGAGGHGRVVLDIAVALKYKVSFFVDDRPPSPEIEGIRVLRSSDLEESRTDVRACVVGIGANRIRHKVFSQLLGRFEPIRLIHPFTAISTSARFGVGTVAMAGVVVNAAAVIGDNVILNTSCSIDHDCVIHSHAHICPGVHLAGTVTVGAGTMIGTGAAVIPGISIGENCLIGAGAVVVHDIPPHSKAFGNPARVIGPNEPFDFNAPVA